MNKQINNFLSASGKIGYILFSISLMMSCGHDSENLEKPLFELLDAGQTGIDFQNTIRTTNEFNILKYRNFYNGGGVGLGDVNNDGLLDVYVTGNMLPNALFLNKGNFVFEEISDAAQITGKGAFSTGVSMVDINGDDWLDI
jgi:hypothetical protein